MRPTLASIATEAGVSTATVSKVLNGKSDVAPATRQRIEEILRSHNYPLRRPRRTQLIDLVMAGLDSPWAVEILRGVEAECAERGAAAVVSQVPADHWEFLPALHGSDGVILVTSPMTPAQRQQIDRAGIGLVLIDPANIPDTDISSVGATNWSGGMAATDHLIGLGHRRIAAIGGPAHVMCTQARLDGYRSALKGAGISIDPDLIGYGDFHHEGGFHEAQRLLALPEPPTAIFAGSDQQAMGAYEAARQAGLRVPQDLSVVGFDDLPMSRWLSPPLTTVRQPLEEMGRAAARTLFQLLDGLPPVSPRVELATELRIRHSTAPPEDLDDRALHARGLPVTAMTGRAAGLLAGMTVEEKVGQLAAYWAAPGTPGHAVAPMQAEFAAPDLDTIAGLGGLTRVFGTGPISAEDGLVRLRALQAQIMERFGVPAIAHEECLTGVMTKGATLFPAPPSWGASFDPGLVEEMAAAIAETMRSLGIQQGLAPVLDVTRDPRWGRTEETIGEDPYLVAQIGTAYVRGLEGSGVVATLKHFAGYSASRGARNMAPTTIGPREFADVILEPFVTAIREGGARAAMPSYSSVDGVPPAADERLLTELLREELGFRGIVVADYFGISFLETQHGLAGSPAEAAALALRAGVDMELPMVRCYGEPLAERARRGDVPGLDEAVSRVLALKEDLGLLDENWALPGRAPADLDPPAHRAIARRLAEESVVLLANDGLLPLRAAGASGASAAAGRIALVGPLTGDPLGMLGCYSFPNHVGGDPGVEIPTLADALAEELPDAELKVVSTDDILVAGDAAIDAAVAAAREAEVCVLAVGDRSGMFGRGTSGEGCDAEDLALPGRQGELADAVLATGTPTMVVVVSGRPYALGGIAERARAIVQSFLPGEEGGRAIAGVLSGRVAPSGRLPIGIPRDPAGHLTSYLRSRMDDPSSSSTLDSTPLYPFGHGLTYTSFDYADLSVDPEVATDGLAAIAVTVRNAGKRAGTEVVQLYLCDPVASVVRPQRWLAGFARVDLAPGESARVSFAVHADRTSFTGRDLRRIVEPGLIGVAVGPSSGDLRLESSFELQGPVRVLDRDRVLSVPVEVTHHLYTGIRR